MTLQSRYLPNNTPCFIANMSNNQSISTATWTVLHIDNVVYDSHNGFDTDNYKYIVQEEGIYLITGVGWMGEYLAMGDAMYIVVNVNASNVAQSYWYIYSAGYPSLNASCFYSLVPDDYILMKGYHNYGSDRAFGGTYTQLMAFRIA